MPECGESPIHRCPQSLCHAIREIPQGNWSRAPTWSLPDYRTDKSPIIVTGATAPPLRTKLGLGFVDHHGQTAPTRGVLSYTESVSQRASLPHHYYEDSYFLPWLYLGTRLKHRHGGIYVMPQIASSARATEFPFMLLEVRVLAASVETG